MAPASKTGNVYKLQAHTSRDVCKHSPRTSEAALHLRARPGSHPTVLGRARDVATPTSGTARKQPGFQGQRHFSSTELEELRNAFKYYLSFKIQHNKI